MVVTLAVLGLGAYALARAGALGCASDVRKKLGSFVDYDVASCEVGEWSGDFTANIIVRNASWHDLQSHFTSRFGRSADTTIDRDRGLQILHGDEVLEVEPTNTTSTYKVTWVDSR